MARRLTIERFRSEIVHAADGLGLGVRELESDGTMYVWQCFRHPRSRYIDVELYTSASKLRLEVTPVSKDGDALTRGKAFTADANSAADVTRLLVYLVDRLTLAARHM